MSATVLDSHTHAWGRWPYRPSVPDPATRGSLEQLLFEMDANDVEAAAVVCASIEGNPDNLGYVAEAASKVAAGRLHLIADLDCTWSATYHAPGAPERLVRLADRYPLAGVTHYVEADNDGWLLGTEADELVAAATERGLLLSLALGPAWFSDLCTLASRHRGAVFLCHHLGGLSAAGSAGTAALDQVLAAAAQPNIYLKASGFHYCSQRPWDHPWHDALGVLRALAGAFGAGRLCWGSDFPASRPFCTYRQSLEAVRTHAGFLATTERDAILGGNLSGLLAARSTTTEEKK